MIRTKVISIVKLFPPLEALIRYLRRKYKTSYDSVSSDYSPLRASDHIQVNRLRASWQNSKLPSEQRKLVDQQLQQYKLGKSVDVFDVFVESIMSLPNLFEKSTLLEIGCSSGYYSEVSNLASLPIVYHGCDYSVSFIKLAQTLYPSNNFKVCDATLLDYADKSFDVVVSGCCLLHIPNYVQAIKESVRVSSNYIIFHRTPVVLGTEDKWYRKKAYGIETVEIHLNEENFLSLLKDQGLSIIKTFTLSEYFPYNNSVGNAVRTFVCMKLNP